MKNTQKETPTVVKVREDNSNRGGRSGLILGWFDGRASRRSWKMAYGIWERDESQEGFWLQQLEDQQGLFNDVLRTVKDLG